MNWFERHLNWSLVLATAVLPFIAGGISFLIFFSVFYSGFSSMSAAGVEAPDTVMEYVFSTAMPVFVIYLLVWLALTVFAFVAIWWYLGKKARSKWFMLLFFAPAGLIFLLLLENQAIGYGGDFVGEPVTDYWRPDTGQFSAPDGGEPKELDYSPAKNVQDIAYGGAVKDVRDVGVPSGEVPAAFPPKAPEEMPAEISAEIPPEVSPEALPAEIPEEAPAELPAETPPEAPPVETPVETLAEAPAELPAEIPPEAPVWIPPGAPSAETPVEASVETPVELLAEAKMTEEAVRHEALTMPILLDDAGVVRKCFYHPDADAVNVCSRCRQYVCSQCNYVTGTHPICRNCWDRRAEVPITGVDTGTREGVKLSKSEKIKAEEDESLREFMQLYEQAVPIISIVIKREADGSPSSPVELMEGLKLRPMLEHAQKLPKADGKELQEARKELEQLLLSCIKIAEAAAELVSSGGEAMPSDVDLARLSVDIATVNGLMQGLSQRLASLSQSSGD